MRPKHDSRSQLPSVDRILQASERLIARWGRQKVVATTREYLAGRRKSVIDTEGVDTSLAMSVASIERRLTSSESAGICPVINLTGVVLHTNLGRACLPEVAAQAAYQAAVHPNNIEYDLGTGRRGDRDKHVEALICELTGAEAATVVNNNAAAVVLVLSSLASGREVPVSRGELVEIGGSFRVPEVMLSSGCTLVEVGATNRTHLYDYRNAISSETALLMKVHTSNYRIEGFSESVGEAELASLAHDHNLPLMVDLGSGCLADFTLFNLPHEPLASHYLEAGADIITFSGDKLLGGPQCGIIAGKADLVAKIRKAPLKRALRVDSTILAALREVLKLYRHPADLSAALPTLGFLTRPCDDIRRQAGRVLVAIKEQLPEPYRVNIVDCSSQIGSGALPVENLSSVAIAIDTPCGKNSFVEQLATAMRRLPRPVVGRIHNRQLLLDLRCLDCESIFIEQLPELRSLLAC